MVLGVLLVYLPEHHTRNRQLATLELTRGNCKSQFLRFQGEFTPKVEISLVLYSTSWIAFYNCSAQNPGWCGGDGRRITTKCCNKCSRRSVWKLERSCSKLILRFPQNSPRAPRPEHSIRTPQERYIKAQKHTKLCWPAEMPPWNRHGSPALDTSHCLKKNGLAIE